MQVWDCLVLDLLVSGMLHERNDPLCCLGPIFVACNQKSSKRQWCVYGKVVHGCPALECTKETLLTLIIIKKLETFLFLNLLH